MQVDYSNDFYPKIPLYDISDAEYVSDRDGI